MTTQEWINFCINQHDVICNQKYDQTLPYSQHLKYVDAQYHMFSHLLGQEDERNLVRMGCYGHDLIEDARLTYNDIKDRTSIELAEIVYACTEDKGRNRIARHSKTYYEDLAKNPLACFVKLCDILANVKYSILTNSSMYSKHKLEHQSTQKYLYPATPGCSVMHHHLNRLFEL